MRLRTGQKTEKCVCVYRHPQLQWATFVPLLPGSGLHLLLLVPGQENKLELGSEGGIVRPQS